MKAFLATAVLVYVAFAAFAWLMSDRMMFLPPSSSYRAGQLPIVMVPTDGGSIATLHLPNPRAAITLLYAHGNAEDLGYVSALARGAASRGLRGAGVRLSRLRHEHRRAAVRGGRDARHGGRVSPRRQHAEDPAVAARAVRPLGGERTGDGSRRARAGRWARAGERVRERLPRAHEGEPPPLRPLPQPAPHPAGARPDPRHPRHGRRGDPRVARPAAVRGGGPAEAGALDRGRAPQRRPSRRGRALLVGARRLRPQVATAAGAAATP